MLFLIEIPILNLFWSELHANETKKLKINLSHDLSYKIQPNKE